MELAQLHERIEQNLKQLASDLERGLSDTLKAYLKAMGRLHRYSFTNVILITSQRPDARHVAGFHAWRKFGRFVKRGEKGISIFAPLVRRRAEARAETDEHQSRNMPIGFRAAHVFDVAQTEGEPFPEPATAQGDPGHYMERLKVFVSGLGIKVYSEILPMGVSGASCGGVIELSPFLKPAEEFSVLVHELAHELLHRNERRAETNPTVRETEAEAVAFVVASAIGLDVGTASSDYIQLWRGANALAESLGIIQRAAATILNGLLE